MHPDSFLTDFTASIPLPVCHTILQSIHSLGSLIVRKSYFPLARLVSVHLYFAYSLVKMSPIMRVMNVLGEGVLYVHMCRYFIF